MFREILNLMLAIKLMARVTLDIPADKMQSFIRLIRKLGIDNAIASNLARKIKNRSRRKGNIFNHFSEKFLLFDWEFFSNELEFE